MNFICTWLVPVCRFNRHSGKVRHSPDRFHCGNCHSDCRCSALFLADGLCGRLAGGACKYRHKDAVVLILSGLATGGSWLCYFKALQLGDVNRVVPIDKSSTVLTILLAAALLHEKIGFAQGIGILLIALGTWLMIEKKASDGKSKNAAWLWYALGSAVFAALTAILGKIGISGMESNLGTAIRTGVVLLLSWAMVFITGKQHTLKSIPKKELSFICLSGLATGGSWLCYYRALQDGLASVVVPIDKLSILVTVLFSCLVFHEKLTRRSAAGLVSLVAGTLLMLVP